MFKKEIDFEGMFKEAYSDIKEKKFNKAILIYNKINNHYKELAEDKKSSKVKNDLTILYKELSLYLRINEAYALAQKGNFDSLNSEIKSIHDLTYELKIERDKSPLIEYGEKHYEFFLDIFTYNLSLNEFENKHKEVVNLLEENEIDKAMKEFSQLIIVYNKLYVKLDHENKLELYSKLKEAYRNISIKKLFALAKDKPKIVAGNVREELRVVNKVKKIENREVPQNTFKDLHEMIKKGDYSKALEFYENL